MSYILDALKKIEHEKNKKRSDGRFNISADLFQERKRLPARNGVWKVVAIIVVAALVATVGWFMFKGAWNRKMADIHPPATLSVPVAKPVALPSALPPVPAKPVPLAVPPVATLPATVVTQKQVETDEDAEEASPRAAHRANRRTMPQPVALKQTIQTVQAPADIKLSGIAWQDERSGRRAVINGFLFKEGSIISGAKISEIKADRVRFSSSAGVFEIKLDAIVPAEVKK